jgi:hypothetical protein
MWIWGHIRGGLGKEGLAILSRLAATCRILTGRDIWILWFVQMRGRNLLRGRNKHCLAQLSWWVLVIMLSLTGRSDTEGGLRNERFVVTVPLWIFEKFLLVRSMNGPFLIK